MILEPYEYKFHYLLILNAAFIVKRKQEMFNIFIDCFHSFIFHFYYYYKKLSNMSKNRLTEGKQKDIQRPSYFYCCTLIMNLLRTTPKNGNI